MKVECKMRKALRIQNLTKNGTLRACFISVWREHGFCCFALMIMKLGTIMKLDVFYTMITKTFGT